MKEIASNEKCTGCYACFSICPKNAINLIPNLSGFFYPKINQDLCINCGLCVKVCPVFSPVLNNEPISAYAAISQDLNEYESSASGGASSVFARVIIEKGGVVYGCVQENYKIISHKRISSLEEVFLLKGSKYVQSIIGDTFKNVKEDLSRGLVVLYTGTPCQIAGLKNYLNKDYENLFTLDLVCHGVPSQQYLHNDIEYQLRKEKCDYNQVKVSFRKKGENINDLRYGIFLSNNKKTILKKYYPYNYFISGFMSGILFRENCFICPYARRKRVSDITVADFWGLNGSSLNNGGGVSLILTNTKQGESLFLKSNNKLYYEKRTVDEAVNGNGQLNYPFPKPKEYNKFVKEYLKNGYLISCRKYLTKYIILSMLISLKDKSRVLFGRILILRFIYKNVKKLMYIILIFIY